MEIVAIGDRNGLEAENHGSLDLIELGLSGDSVSLDAAARVFPKQRADASLSIKAINLDLPSVPLAGYCTSNFLLGKHFSSAHFQIIFKVEIGWSNTDTVVNLDPKLLLTRLSRGSNSYPSRATCSLKSSIPLEKVATQVVYNFLSEFPNLLKNTLGGWRLDEIGNFLKDTFGTIGSELITAVSVLENTQPTDVIEQLG
ncbi:hypothetical protein MMC18_005818 [Xylographa bjoerkii]|nr:hypothetical protein [Xylographa bjoerkii]